MKKILHLISSFNADSSYSIKLGRAIVAQLQQANPGAEVEEVNLVTENYPHLDETHFQAFITPETELSAADRAAVEYSNKAINQLMAADFIVIGSPFYNFTIPSVLKAWIDHVVRFGVTFRYSEAGPEGLVLGKKVYIALSSGGVYSEGPAKQYDFNGPYLQATLGMIGMKDVKVFRAEGVKIPGLQEQALNKAIESIVL